MSPFVALSVIRGAALFLVALGVTANIGPPPALNRSVVYDPGDILTYSK